MKPAFVLFFPLTLVVACIPGLASASPPPSGQYHFPPPCTSVNASNHPCISENNCSERGDGETCEIIISLPSHDKEVFQETGLPPRPTAFEKWGLGCLSVGVVSLSGVFGAFLWPIMNTPLYKHTMRALIGLAVGSLTSTALFQLIPEGFRMKETDPNQTYLSTAVFSWLSIWVIFVIEAITKIALTNCEEKKYQAKIVNGINGVPMKDMDMEKNLIPKIEKEALEEPKRKVASVAWMIIFGDGLHNFIDGMSIGAGYSHSVATGLGLSMAIICEEFPHELGDFAILIQSGMSMKRALAYNFMSACTAFLGLALGIGLGQLEGSNYIFSFAGGLFLYISLAHLVPELQIALKEELRNGRNKALIAFTLQNLGILIGTVLIYFITKYNDDITTGF